MINQPLYFFQHEVEDMPRRNNGPLVPVKPLLDWIKRQPDRPLSDVNLTAIKKQIERAAINGEMGFHAADSICCELKVPMAHVFGELYWQIENI